MTPTNNDILKRKLHEYRRILRETDDIKTIYKVENSLIGFTMKNCNKNEFDLIFDLITEAKLFKFNLKG